TGARRVTGLVQLPGGDLGAERRGLHEPAVAAVDGQDVAVGGDRQAQFTHQVVAPGDGEAGPRVVEAEHRVRYRRDAVRHRVGHVERAISAEAYPGRADDQRVRIGLLAEARPDHPGADDERRAEPRHVHD